MKKYTVCIEETCSKEFVVEAENYDEAIDIARRKYNDCEFALDPGDVSMVQIAAALPEEDIVKWVTI